MVQSAQQQWETPGQPVSLTAGQVHVWRARLDGIGYADETLTEILSKDEQERAARFHFDQHRLRFIRSHAICRMILADYLGMLPIKIRFGTTEKGKPFLLLPSNEVGFNLSHSSDLMVLGVTLHGKIGIDVELVSEKTEWRHVAGNFFNQRELNAIEVLPTPQEQISLFYKIWTLKEAYLKAIGEGVAGGLERVEVQTDPRQAPGFLALPGQKDEKNRWQVFTFQPAAGANGAIVVEKGGYPRQLSCFTWASLPKSTVY